ncbi:MAG: copper resistance protein CopC [Candidatus Rokubacteria bacterium]|nr:copper resistance protein CopC [Candidatus Rokubacteria bacterium]
MTRRRVLVLAIVLAVLPAPVAPHSLLVAATPSADARLEVGPPEVVLRFNSRIEKRLSRLRLVNDRGEARALMPSVDGAPEELRAPVPPLATGTWRLEWRVLSADGHVVSGGYSFHVVR